MFTSWESGKRAAGGGVLSDGGFKPGGLFNADSFNQFLGSPEALALAAALLEGGQPSFTEQPSFGRSLSKGLTGMAQARDVDRQRRLAEQEFELKKLKHPAEIAELEARAKYYGSGGTLQGMARDYADLNKVLNDPNIPQNIKDMALEAFKRKASVEESLIDTRRQINTNRDFKNLPADDKRNVIAGFRGLGIGEKEAIQFFNDGYTPGSYAKEQLGMTEDAANNIDKLFAPTSSTVTQIQTAEGALAEEEYINPIISEAMAPYARKFAGYSPRQMADALSSDPDKVDKVAKFYAARALQPEVAGIRSRMAGGSNAQQALHDIQADALNKIKILEGEVSPEAYTKASKYISEWINGMTRARINAMKGMESSKKGTATGSATARNASEYSDAELWAIVNGNK